MVFSNGPLLSAGGGGGGAWGGGVTSGGALLSAITRKVRKLTLLSELYDIQLPFVV